MQFAAAKATAALGVDDAASAAPKT